MPRVVPSRLPPRGAWAVSVAVLLLVGLLARRFSTTTSQDPETASTPTPHAAEDIDYWRTAAGAHADRPDGRANIGTVHEAGRFHRGAHVYALALPSGRLLVTKRSLRMAANPGCFNNVGEHHNPATPVHRAAAAAASGGGQPHQPQLQAETHEDCARRGFREELGWSLPAERFHVLGTREYDRRNSRGRRDWMNLTDVFVVVGDDEVEDGLGRVAAATALLAPPPIPVSGKLAETSGTGGTAPNGAATVPPPTVAPPRTVKPGLDGTWRFEPSEVDSVALLPIPWVFRWLSGGNRAGMCSEDISRFVLEGLVLLCRAMVSSRSSALSTAAGTQAESLCGEARRFDEPFQFAQY
jgi:isopentenyldiphosphate isomerase